MLGKDELRVFRALKVKVLKKKPFYYLWVPFRKGVLRVVYRCVSRFFFFFKSKNGDPTQVSKDPIIRTCGLNSWNHDPFIP